MPYWLFRPEREGHSVTQGGAVVALTYVEPEAAMANEGVHTVAEGETRIL